LLDDIDLSEGQEVNVSISSDAEIARRVLSSILVPTSLPSRRDIEAIDEEALLREIDAELSESPRLSDAIIEERYEEERATSFSTVVP
jgi:predicted DNA-binding antitoxin AbrB/MazE fold protein